MYIYSESYSEASTSGATPASVIEPEDGDIPPGEPLENDLEVGNSICAAAQAFPRKGDDHIPAMPCGANYEGEPHRPKIVPFNSHIWITMNACVARPVSRKDILQSPPAQASMKAEYRFGIQCSGMKTKSASGLTLPARPKRAITYEFNFGYLFGICVEKNSELPPLHPKWEFKGRVVFQGNRVTNQNWEAAIVQDMGSCPATMKGSKAADLYGLAPGHAVDCRSCSSIYSS